MIVFHCWIHDYETFIHRLQFLFIKLTVIFFRCAIIFIISDVLTTRSHNDFFLFEENQALQISFLCYWITKIIFRNSLIFISTALFLIFIYQFVEANETN